MFSQVIVGYYYTRDLQEHGSGTQMHKEGNQRGINVDSDVQSYVESGNVGTIILAGDSMTVPPK